MTYSMDMYVGGQKQRCLGEAGGQVSEMTQEMALEKLRN